VHRAASAALIGVVLAATGCGGGGAKPPDAKQVGDAVTGYAHAFGGGDGVKACGLLTSDARDAFVKRVSSLVGTTDCAEAMSKLQTFAGPNVTGPFQDATVSAVKVSGDRATANLVAAGHSEQVTLERQNGDWLLTKAPGT
jgi:hypothetical protein